MVISVNEMLICMDRTKSSPIFKEKSVNGLDWRLSLDSNKM